jgi:hypothetical protein
VELVEPAPETELALAVLAPDEEGDVLFESTAARLPFLDADGDLGMVGEDGSAVPDIIRLVEVDFIIVFFLVRVH